jgi:hypothetical protein
MDASSNYSTKSHIFKRRVPTKELEAEFDRNKVDFDKKADEKSNNINIRKTVKISYDGKQFLIRIPNEISSYYNLKKGDELEILIEPDNVPGANRLENPLVLKVIKDGTA